MANFGDDELMPHFIYCGNYYGNNLESDRVQNFKKLILKKMKKMKIQSSMLTMLDMWRLKLVTEEKAEEAWDGMLEDRAALRILFLYWFLQLGCRADENKLFSYLFFSSGPGSELWGYT